ncbi:MAG: DNA cytosine methyltransferase, partial [Acidovorax sp.]|nr:DNA cytosine methyltransferase [Acidovorax sp.]
QCLRARTPGNIDNSSTTVVQQPVAYGIRTANTSSNGWGIQEEVTHTLDCAQGVAVAQPVSFAIQADALRVNPASGPDGVGVQADHAYTLEARAEVQVVAFAENTRAEVRLEGGDGQRTGALSTGGGKPGQGVPCVAYTLEARAEVQAVAVALRGREGGATAELGDEVQNCLRASSGGGDKPHVLTAMQVRRLLPEECEALQGFPRSYTKIPWRKKPASECPDGPRYKALGNSWAVPNVRWIGQRIDAAVRRLG